MLVRVMTLHYGRRNKTMLYRVDYGVKFKNPKRADKYCMVSAQMNHPVKTDFTKLSDQFDYVKIMVRGKETERIPHYKFMFDLKTQTYRIDNIELRTYKKEKVEIDLDSWCTCCGQNNSVVDTNMCPECIDFTHEAFFQTRIDAISDKLEGVRKAKFDDMTKRQQARVVEELIKKGAMF